MAKKRCADGALKGNAVKREVGAVGVAVAVAVAGAGAGAGSPPRTVTISAPKTRAKRAATGDADAHQLPTPGDLALLGTHYVDEVVLDKHVYR
jgi:hypothetical protein